MRAEVCRNGSNSSGPTPRPSRDRRARGLRTICRSARLTNSGQASARPTRRPRFEWQRHSPESLVTCAPHMRLVAHLAELGSDADAFARAEYTPLQNMAHVQLPSDLANARVLLLCNSIAVVRAITTQTLRLKSTKLSESAPP